MKLFINVSGKNHEVEIPASGIIEKLNINGKNISIDSQWLRNNSAISLIIDGKTYVAEFDSSNEQNNIQINGHDFTVSVKDERSKAIGKILGNGSIKKSIEGSIKAPMPGLIVKLNVSEGDLVRKGDGVIIIEAMKMENEIHAQISGTIEKIMVETGQAVDKGALLMKIKPD
ncbi:biotin/lipoyl-binding protein [bacterium]|nr:biotin/lipoyl-binding protein [bacterium]